jgi:DNA-binding MarR family transcriptional regulator
MESPHRPIAKTEYESLAIARMAIRRFCRSSERMARMAGLTPQQQELLLVIRGYPGRDWTTMNELAGGLQLRHNSAVGLVNRCEQMGLVQRLPHPEDARQIRVCLTEKSEALLQRLAGRHLLELEFLQRMMHQSVISLLDRLDPS